MGVSVDHVPCLKAWAASLEGISFRLASDFWPHGAAARRFGVFRDGDGHSERAIFLVDREGIVRYVDVHDIDAQPDNEVLFAALATLEPALVAGAAQAGATPPERSSLTAGSTTTPPSATTSSDLIMYCTPWCPDCRRARTWLKEHDLAYVEVDVSADGGARERAAGLNGGELHTPTFEIGDSVCVDFRPDHLAEILGLDQA